MLARRFACFGWRLTNQRLHIPAFRLASALRFQSTAPKLDINDIVEKLTNEVVESTSGHPNQTEQSIKDTQFITQIFTEAHDSGANLTDADLKTAVKQISSRMSSIENPDMLMRLLVSFPKGHVARRELFAPIAEKISRFVNLMDTTQVLLTFDALRKLFWRDEDLLIKLAEHLIRQRQDLTLRNTTSLAISMRGLTFTHPRLVKYLIGQFVRQLDESGNWMFLATMTFSMSVLKINSPTFWLAVCNWTDKNIRTANSKHIHDIVTSCANVNVPASIFQKPIKIVTDQLQSNPKIRASATSYLNTAYSLAIFNALPHYEANKILQPEFFHDIAKFYIEIKPNVDSAKMLTMRAAMRIMQINAYCRYDLSVKSKLPKNLLTFFNENTSMIETIRYGPKFEPTLADFRQNLYMSAPLKTHALKPHTHMSTGTFLDALLWICPERKVILPIEEGKKSENAEKVGVMFAPPSMLTTLDAGIEVDSGLPLVRPIGDMKLSMRHLHAAKIRPVFIDSYAYIAISDNVKKIKYIKETIVNPSDDWTKDWH